MLNLSTVEITGSGTTTKVIVNGVDVTNGATKLEYSHEGGEFPTLKIEFSVGKTIIKNTCLVNCTNETIDEMVKKIGQVIENNSSLVDC